MLISNMSKAIIVNSSLITYKTTRTAQGAALFTLRKNQFIENAIIDHADKYENIKKYKKTKLPASGVVLEERDVDAMQLSLI